MYVCVSGAYCWPVTDSVGFPKMGQARVMPTDEKNQRGG